jgi:serine/threonine protein kinase
MPMSSARTVIRALTLPYESLRTLYEGGCEVHLYKNEISGQLQVGKRIDILGLEKAVAVREAQLLTTINHPNVVPVSEVADVSGYDDPMKVIELIMPYYTRGSVFDTLARGERFSLGEARRHVIEALLGLSEIHESYGILHRDVKSPNVLLDESGGARVGDLGVSIPMDSDGTAEAYPSAQLFGAPETFTTGRVSRASDIYQMGLVALELVNGPFPYDEYPSRDVIARLEKGRRGPRPKDLKFLPVVPKRMRSVITKAIALDPPQRYQSASQMADALRRVPLIDWRIVVDEPERKIWEGEAAGKPGRRFRVEAKTRRKGGWVLTGRQLVTRWQRVVPDQIVTELTGRDARGFFDAMVAIATSR